ncbi:uncharacterized protein TNCV_4329821 [Trichonephila clavipes]|nr:uncharacterized protein TNCV_4329821 [Trichonephila clavipes]
MTPFATTYSIGALTSGYRTPEGVQTSKGTTRFDYFGQEIEGRASACGQEIELGEKAENILVYVKDEEIRDYNKLKSLVLREFEPTPLICLQNFQKAKRMPNETHVQLASRLSMNWDQYCNLRNVNDFNSLKELIVSDQLYETLDNETAVHINVKQEQNWFKPIQMGKE